ncbi:MAG: hypothetical protein ACKOYN_02495 [Planctomycetota bacterium]
MTTTASTSACTVRLEGRHGQHVHLSVPGTEYVLELVLASGGSFGAAEGKRVQGTVSGRAQKLHRAQAGGEFIEPVEGHPRIVQGRVRESDIAGNRLLVHAVVPMWIALDAGQSARDFHAGDFVNFYMESGVTFAPLA